MSYSLARIKQEFHNICEQAGVDSYDTPIRINGRLTRTLGRVSSAYDYYLEKYVPREVEFSKRFIESATDANIYSVIQHEAAHYIACARSGETHGHDNYFKSICHEIGCSNDGTKTTIEKTISDEEYYRYSVSCPNCGPIGGYSRMCNSLRYIEDCRCRKCGSYGLTYKKNW